MFLQFDARNHTVVVLPALRTILVLPFEGVLLLKLYWQGATTEMSPDLYSKGSCPRIIYNFGTGSCQLPSSKLVLNGDSAVQ